MITEFVNINNLYDPSRVITNHNPLTKDKKFSDDGLFSEKLFGKTNNSEMLSYTCKCGKYKGKFLKGYKCEVCGEEVKEQESKLNVLAWIDLKKYWVINPVFYYLISKLAGGINDKKLNEIISYEKKLDKEGQIVEEEDENNPYKNIGLVEFKEKFFKKNGILQYLYNNSKNKDKDLIYKIILSNHDKIFVNHIPVFDTILRPASVTYKDVKPVFRFDEVNNSYNFIIKLSNMINKESSDLELINLPNLFNIQMKYNNVFNKIIENLAGKFGFIRSNMLGNRLNFSSRSVITPLPPGYDVCDITVPYLSFVELYSYHLINILVNIKNISMDDAQKIIFEAQTKFNPEIYKLCNELLHKTKMGLLVLGIRNPTISRGSVLCHNIAKIKDDFSDLTLSVHNCILALIAGDYDGDVYNLFPIFDNEYKRVFWNAFSPVNMFISNNDGLFNPRVSLDRDQVIGMFQFNNQN